MARDSTEFVPTRWLSRAALAQLAGGVTFAAMFAYFSVRAKFTSPYFDDWSLIASLQNRPWTRTLWAPHNEHITVVSRLLIWLDLWLWGWPGYATWAAGLLSHFGMAGVLIWTTRDHSTTERRWLAGVVLILMCLTYELQGVVFPGSVSLPLVAFFGCLALAFFCHAAERPAQQGRLVALSAALSVAAMLSISNGFLVPAVLVGLSVILRLPRWTTVAMTALTIGAFLLRYSLAGVPGTLLVAEPLAIIRFALAMLAGPLATISSAATLIVGGAFVVGGLVATGMLTRRLPAAVAPAVLLGNVWFVLLSAGTASLGRAQFDLSIGAESRYTEVVALGWASLVLLWLPQGFLAWSTGRLLAGAVPVITFGLVLLQAFVGDVWAIKADSLNVGSLALTVGVADDNWLWHLGGAAFITNALPELRAHDAAFLRFPDRGRKLPDAPACGGTLVATPASSNDKGFELYGALDRGGASVRVVDRAGKVVGIGKPAPPVIAPRTFANSMVWAEIDQLRGNLDRKGHWLGFAQTGEGAPYSVRLLDSSGHVLCAAPVGCCAAVPQPPDRQELITRGGIVEGYLDGADCSTISGWAWDSVRPGRPVDVKIRISSGTQTSLQASSSRPDLAQHTHGYIDHGFLLTKPQLNIPQGTWKVEALTAGSGVPLVGSPKTITCP